MKGGTALVAREFFWVKIAWQVIDGEENYLHFSGQYKKILQ
jgi:hypothetical protein